MLQKFCPKSILSHRFLSIEVMEMEADSGGAGEGGSGPDEPAHLAGLLHLRHPPHYESAIGGMVEEESELVDLQELSTLSDGDLCMSRQLAAAMAPETGGRQFRIGSGTVPKRRWPEQEEDEEAEDEAEEMMTTMEEAQHPMMSGSKGPDECLGELVDPVRGNFLPTEAVEQFLRGMGGGGGGTMDGDGGTMMELGTVKEEVETPIAPKKTKMNNNAQRASSTERWEGRVLWERK